MDNQAAEAVATGGLRVEPGVDFPLPPPELMDALDNPQGLSTGSTAPASVPAAQAGSKPVAVLDFIGGSPGVTVTLAFPFRLEGREVREITVRPLTVIETGDLLRSTGATADNYDFYALMTGLPAAVIRALPADDGERVTDAAYGFLPRYLKGVPTG